MEAALDSFPEGIALLDCDGRVVYWNHAAEAISGFPSIEIVARRVPGAIEPLIFEDGEEGNPRSSTERGALVRAQHKLGHELTALVRTRILRDDLGERIGCAVTFRAADHLDTLPHGNTSSDSEAEETQANMEERVEEDFKEFKKRGSPFGLVWITVDQAGELRKTHGARACEAMLERVERTLANGLRPTEELGRWGDDEFLVLAHAPTPENLAAHAQVLAGLARTADFRWWGDRLTLTVSIGAAQADQDETLVQLLERAQAAMHSSLHAGGNHITLAPGRRACSPL